MSPTDAGRRVVRLTPGERRAAVRLFDTAYDYHSHQASKVEVAEAVRRARVVGVPDIIVHGILGYYGLRNKV